MRNKMNKKLIKEVILAATQVQRLVYRDFLAAMAEYGEAYVPGAQKALKDFDNEKYDGTGLATYLSDDEYFRHFIKKMSPTTKGGGRND